jgi:hypothetical protein
MPLLLNVLPNANGPDYRKLRVKAMECAGLIGSSSVAILMIRFYAGSCVAIAVGRISSVQMRTLVDYLIVTWEKICQAMGPEFEPYLPVVMPPPVSAASTKTDISVYGTHGPQRRKYR